MNVFSQYLDGRAGQPPSESPDAMVSELLGEIGRRFYARNDGERWLKHQPALMLALTWPGGWLKQRGVTLPLPRYRAIMMEIVQGIADHGKVAKIGYFPAYLLQCVRLWFVHNGEELYEAQKSIRNAIDLRILKGGTAAPAGPDPIEALAAAHRVLAGRKRSTKTPASDKDQLSLL